MQLFRVKQLIPNTKYAEILVKLVLWFKFNTASITKLYMWAIVNIYLISLLLADYSLLWKQLWWWQLMSESVAAAFQKSEWRHCNHAHFSGNWHFWTIFLTKWSTKCIIPLSSVCHRWPQPVTFSSSGSHQYHWPAASLPLPLPSR